MNRAERPSAAPLSDFEAIAERYRRWSIGNPKFAGAGGTFITAATPMIPQTADPNVEGGLPSA